MNKTSIKKIICIVLVLSLILSIFTSDVFAIGTQNSEKIWDGKTSAPAGEGSEKSPYLISNGAELAYVISTGGGENNYYRLTADIYLNDIDKVNWATGEGIDGYSPRTWYDSAEFQGNIDGNGFVVYGVYYNAGLDTSEMAEGFETPVGLIPAVKNGATVSIKNLGVDKMYINAKYTASAFFGRAGNSSATTEESRSIINIDRCFVGEDVDVTAFCTGVFRGYSRNNGTYISNSYNLGKFRSDADKKNHIDGGTYDYRFSWFVGNSWGINDELYIDGCYNATGALFRAHWATLKDKITNCYAAGLTEDKDGDGVAESVWYSASGAPLTKERMQGEDVLVSAQKMAYLNANSAYMATKGYPVLKVFAKGVLGDVEDPGNLSVWDGTVAESLSGEGSESSPHLITNGSELAFAISSGGADKFYKLTNDIYLNDTSKINWKTGEAASGYTPNSWFDNQSFKGTIDGDGHIVYGLYFETPDKNYAWGYYGDGLIPRVNAGDNLNIKALGIDNAYICGINGASAFVGFAGDKESSVAANITIDGCFVGENVTLIGHDVGAFRGGAYKSDIIIRNSYSSATLKGSSTNGLFGNIWETNVEVENSFNANGAITTDYYDVDSVGKNLNNVYATDAGEYTSEVGVLTKSQMKDISAVNTMSLPTDIFIPVENKAPVLKAFFKYSETKDGDDYTGYKYSRFCKYFTTEDTTKRFWRFDDIDVNGDSDTDICDLVFVMRKYNDGKNTLNIDGDRETSVFDISILRKSLVGNTDYDKKPIRFTPQNNNISDKYDYVWGDEFEEDYLDSDKWTVYAKMGANPSLGFHNDKDEKVIGVEDGSLRLTAYKDENGEYHVPTSVLTRDTMNFAYGYVEIRASLPLQTGVWSSFWALTVADTASIGRLATPKCENVAEIDIFEVFNTNEVCGTIIKWADEAWYPRSKDGTQRMVLNDNEFHIFGYEWTPTEINYYCDGVIYAHFDITEPWTNPGEYGKGKEGWTYTNADETGYDMSCFSDPQYLIFNNHLFYEGISNANQYINISNPDFKSADYLIDYCRVYQLDGQELYTK